ncbi:hypothetical protein FRC15_002421 [Serendipita sp. 397]|nr:hypothetical protein FRC15_002421 [Serendipita sp. 397]
MDDLIDGFQVVQWLGSETRISDEDGREEAATALWHRPAMSSTLTLATDLLSIPADMSTILARPTTMHWSRKSFNRIQSGER